MIRRTYPVSLAPVVLKTSLRPADKALFAETKLPPSVERSIGVARVAEGKDVLNTGWRIAYDLPTTDIADGAAVGIYVNAIFALHGALRSPPVGQEVDHLRVRAPHIANLIYSGYYGDT